MQEQDDIAAQFQQVFQAALAAQLQVICSEPNSDAGGQLIRAVLDNYKNHSNVHIVKHMPRALFIDCLTHCDVMLGNSSSGIIEAASLNLNVVNIGSRQNLREYSDNAIHTETSFDAVLAGLTQALSSENKKYKNVYGGGNISELCCKLLQTIPLNSEILNKCNAY